MQADLRIDRNGPSGPSGPGCLLFYFAKKTASDLPVDRSLPGLPLVCFWRLRSSEKPAVVLKRSSQLIPKRPRLP